jgi:hypothetical protein
LLVFHNPTNGKLYIDFNSIIDYVSLFIKDVKGVILERHNYYNFNSLELNLNYPAGIYFITISSANRSVTIRLILY